MSIHCNAAASPEGSGWEVWHTIHEERSTGDELAEAIAAHLKRLTPLAARGTKERESESRPGTDYYHVIRRTRMPAVICEVGFVSSPKDAAYLKSPEGQAAIAEAIARGVVEWAGLTWRPAEPPAVPKPAPKPGPAVPKPTPNPGPFPDVPGGHWAAGDILWAREAGVVRGFEDGTFRPAEPVTRAEAVVMVRRAVEWAIQVVQKAVEGS